MLQNVSDMFFDAPSSKTGRVLRWGLLIAFLFWGKSYFDAPTGVEAEIMRKRYEETCIWKRDENRHSEYCRTHKLDGSKRTESEIAATGHKAVSESAPSAANRADFEALLKDTE